MNNIAVRFVTWDIPALEQLSESKVYKIKQKCIKGEQLTREEKNWVSEKLCYSSSKTAIPLQGWSFSFRGYLKRYVVRQYDSWSEHYAFDKTALRKALCGKIEEIHEIPS
jgi:hypothetical protein